jgi:hypothetical protein
MGNHFQLINLADYCNFVWGLSANRLANQWLSSVVCTIAAWARRMYGACGKGRVGIMGIDVRLLSRGEVGGDVAVDLTDCVVWLANDLSPQHQRETLIWARRQMLALSAEMLQFDEPEAWRHAQA